MINSSDYKKIIQGEYYDHCYNCNIYFIKHTNDYSLYKNTNREVIKKAPVRVLFLCL